MQTIH